MKRERAEKKGIVMNVISEQVEHSRFGLGVVLSQTSTMIEVRFEDAFGIKKFVYPSAFDSFLVLCRPALQASMAQELAQIREQIEAERLRKIEADRLHEEAVRTLLAQHIAAKKAPKPRAPRAKKAAKTTPTA